MGQQDQECIYPSRVEVGLTDRNPNARDLDLERGQSLGQSLGLPLDATEDDDTALRAPPATRSRMSESGGIEDTDLHVRSTRTRMVNQLMSRSRAPREIKTILGKYLSIHLDQNKRVAVGPRRSGTDPHDLTVTPAESAVAIGTDRGPRSENAKKLTSTMIMI